VWRLLDRLVLGLWRSGPLFFLIGVSPGLTLWYALKKRGAGLSVSNLSSAERHSVLAWMAVSLLLGVAAAGATFAAQRRREPELELAGAIARFNRAALAVLALPLIAALASPGIETSMPILTTLLITVLAAISATVVYRLLSLPRFASFEEPFQPAARPWAARVVLGAALLGYAALISAYAVIDHHNLGTAYYDLGLYDNILWNTLHGNFLGTTLAKGGDHTSAHFDPILGLVSLPYALYPRAEFLLVFQTLWLCSGALAVWALAKEHLVNEWLAVLCAVVFLLYPALHGVNLFDFHSLALIVPLLVWAIYLLDAGRLRLYWPVLALLLLCREDVSLLACFIGVYAILSGHTRSGVATILISLTYLALVKNFGMHDSSLLMAKSDKTHSYVFYFEEMIPYPEEGARGLVVTALTNPLYTLKVFFKPERVLFFLRLIVPLLALPLLARKKRVLMIYGLAFLGLASRNAVFSLYFQYSSVFFPLLFAALPDGLRRVVDSPTLPAAYGLRRAPLAWALAAGVLVATTGMSFKYGGIVPNAAFRAGWTPLQRFPDPKSRERHQWVRKMIDRIGPDAPVASTDILGAQLTNRRGIYRYPELGDARYLFVMPREFGKIGRAQYSAMLREKKLRLIEKKHGIELYEILGYPKDVAPADADWRLLTQPPEAGSAP
jgi:uncharacterized membrane protein